MAGRGCGGFPCGSAVEVTGPSGIGKTALCVQIAIRHRLDLILEQLERHARERATREVRLRMREGLASCTCLSPELALSLDAWLDAEILPACGQVLLIDTEGGISAARIVDAVDEALTEEALRRAAACIPVNGLLPALQRGVLLGVHVVRVLSLGDLIAYLGEANGPGTKIPQRLSLVVLDSLSTYFYLGALPQGMSRQQWRERSDACAHVLESLYSLRRQSDPATVRVSVIVTTSMYTRSLGEGQDVLVPAGAESRPATAAASCEWGASELGNAWRIVLFYNRTRYRALYVQSAPLAACAAIHPDPVHRCIPSHVTERCY